MHKLTKKPSNNPYAVYYDYRGANISSDKDASVNKFSANFYGVEGMPQVQSYFNRMTDAKAWVDTVIERNN